MFVALLVLCLIGCIVWLETRKVHAATTEARASVEADHFQYCWDCSEDLTAPAEFSCYDCGKKMNLPDFVVWSGEEGDVPSYRCHECQNQYKTCYNTDAKCKVSDFYCHGCGMYVNGAPHLTRTFEQYPDEDYCVDCAEDMREYEGEETSNYKRCSCCGRMTEFFMVLFSYFGTPAEEIYCQACGEREAASLARSLEAQALVDIANPEEGPGIRGKLAGRLNLRKVDSKPNNSKPPRKAYRRMAGAYLDVLVFLCLASGCYAQAVTTAPVALTDEEIVRSAPYDGRSGMSAVYEVMGWGECCLPHNRRDLTVRRFVCKGGGKGCTHRHDLAWFEKVTGKTLLGWVTTQLAGRGDALPETRTEAVRRGYFGDRILLERDLATKGLDWAAKRRWFIQHDIEP